MLQIKKNDGIFNEVKFVAAAVSKSHNAGGGYDLRAIRSTGDGLLVGTDGYALHVWQDSPFPQGDYQIIQNNKSMIILDDFVNPSYPDTQKLIRGLGDKAPQASYAYGGGIDAVFAEITRAMDVRGVLSMEYFKRAFEFIPEGEYRTQQYDRPTVLSQGRLTAYIMPILV